MTGEPARRPGGAEILIVGVGNEFRSDDGAGLCVVRELRRRGAIGVCVLEASGEATNLMQAWEGKRAAAIVDAVCSGHPAGTVHRLDVSRTPLPRSFLGPSAHTFGVAEAVEMSRTLGRLPPTVILYGIDGQTFDYGQGLSDPVLKGIPSLLSLLQSDLSLLLGGGRLVFPPTLSIL